jgi:AraC-like DNA-binding protein
MLSLEQLLDGLSLAIGPVAVHRMQNGALDAGYTDQPALHYILRGAAWLDLAESKTVAVATRTVIVVPPRRRARIVVPNGAHGAQAVLVSVGMRVTYHRLVAVFEYLHEPLVERVSANDPIRRTFEELLDEVGARRPGSHAMSETLLRRCLIWLLRRCFERGTCALAWLAPLEDARLGRALAAMHERPEHCFTLAELAELAGMSRSVFAARFAQAVGQSPIESLKAARLARAAELLTRTDLPVKRVAAQVGYASRSSFTRAFCARHGRPPADFRTPGRRADTNVA